MLANRLLILYLTILFSVFALNMTLLANYTVSGTLKYEDLTQDKVKGFLRTTHNRPIRYADILVLDGSDVISQGATDENGMFSINITASSEQNVRVLVVTSTENTEQFILSVVDYVDGIRTGNPYAFELFRDVTHSASEDITIGVKVAEYHNGGDEFNIFDVGIDALSYLANEMEEPTPLPELIVEFTFKENGTKFAFWNGVSVSLDGAYGYDDTIQLHEMGHWMQASFGVFSDNTGGSHYIGDSQQDPRLSFGEAWPTFMGSNIRVHYHLETGNVDAYNHPSVYMNSNGSIDGGQGFAYDLENTHEWMKGSGAASEVAVQAAMWDLTDGPDTPDFEPGTDDDQEYGFFLNRDVLETWELVTNNLAQPPFNGFLTYEDWHDEWIANIADPQADDLNGMQNYEHQIQYMDDLNEPNNSMEEAVDVTNTPFLTHCTTWPAGDEDWFWFYAYDSVKYKIKTSNIRDGADTFITLKDSAGNIIKIRDNIEELGSPPNAGEAFSTEMEWTASGEGNYYINVIRSTRNDGHGGGDVSKYGNWDFSFYITEVPDSYANMNVEPDSSLSVTVASESTDEYPMTIRNRGTKQELVYSISEVNAESGTPENFTWLEIAPVSGTVPAGEIDELVINFNATGLNLGSYEAGIKVESNDLVTPSWIIPVTMLVTPTTAVEDELQIPGEYALYNNYPNPFNPSTTIKYDLPNASNVTLKIYNIAGEELVTLAHEFQQAGQKSVSWNGKDNFGSKVSSGIYFYRIVAGDFVESKKMILLK